MDDEELFKYLAELEEEGLIKRIPHASDHMQDRFMITDAGRAVVKEKEEQFRKFMSHFE